MIYDNALLAMAYLKAWQVTGDSSFKQVPREKPWTLWRCQGEAFLQRNQT